MDKLLTLLIADDEKEARELLAMLFESEGYRLIFAKNGTEALELAEEHRPDLVLLDIVMPGLDGYEVCRRLRNDKNLRLTPVLMITGYSLEDAAVKGLAVGAEDVIAKPFHLGELRLRVKTILKLNRFRILHEKREQMNWLVEDSTDGFVRINEDGEITYYNQVARRILAPKGYQKLEGEKFCVIADRYYHFVTPELWAKWPKIKDHAYLVRPATDSKPACWIRVTRLPCDYDLDGSIIRLRDETPEVTLRQKIWSFETMISHKLRTPMHGLSGALELLKQSDLSEEEETDLKHVAYLSSERLSEAIESILEHRESYLHVLNNKRSCLKELERECVEMAQEFQLQEIEKNFDPELETKTFAIPSVHLSIILREICENSVKFHPDQKPRIQMEARLLKDGFSAVVLTDDGPGVKDNFLEHVTQPYFQVDEMYTGEIPGMGLGLSRVNTLLAGYGGRFWVANREEGQGLVVTMKLPVIDMTSIDAETDRHTFGIIPR